MVVSCHYRIETKTPRGISNGDRLQYSQVWPMAGFLLNFQVLMSYLEGASWFGSLLDGTFRWSQNTKKLTPF
jgi:hypothetical protein